MATYRVRIKGRISNAAAIAQRYGATKIKDGQYWAYEIAAVEERELSVLDEEVTAVGCWTEMESNSPPEWMDGEAADTMPIHPAYERFIPHVTKVLHGLTPDNADIQAFVIDQVDKLQRKLGPQYRTELDAIIAAIRSEGGAAYERYRARLLELNQKTH